MFNTSSFLLFRFGQNELNAIGRKAAEFRVESTTELISSVSEATEAMAMGTRAIFEGITIQHLEQHKEKLEHLEAALLQKCLVAEANFTDNIRELKPSLAHPARASQLQKLLELETARQNEIKVVAEAHENGVSHLAHAVVSEASICGPKCIDLRPFSRPMFTCKQ